MRQIGLLTIAAHLSACSFAFVHGPPPGQPARAIATKGDDKLVCTSPYTVPVLDTIFTAVVAVNLLLAIGGADKPISRGVAIPLFTLGTAAGGAGMYYGYTRVKSCHAAHDELIKAGIERPEDQARPGGLTVPSAPL
jgi:hypothetical protein